MADAPGQDDVSCGLFWSPFTDELRDKATRFYCSLTEEQEMFHLSLDQILAARLVVTLEDASGQVLGVAGFRQGFWADVLFLVVRKDHQGRGHGKTLTAKVIASTSPRRFLLLSVMRSNLHARKLYKSMKFVTLTRHKTMAYMALDRGVGRYLRWPLRLALVLRNLFRPGLAG